jgi:hypothetical protein
MYREKYKSRKAWNFLALSWCTTLPSPQSIYQLRTSETSLFREVEKV